MKWNTSADDFEQGYEMHSCYCSCFSTWILNELLRLIILNVNMKWIASADGLNWKSEVLQWIWKAFPLLLTILDQAQKARHEYRIYQLSWWSKPIATSKPNYAFSYSCQLGFFFLGELVLSSCFSKQTSCGNESQHESKSNRNKNRIDRKSWTYRPFFKII